MAERCARDELFAAADTTPPAPHMADTPAAAAPGPAAAVQTIAATDTGHGPSPSEVAAAIDVLTRYQAMQGRLASAQPR